MTFASPNARAVLSPDVPQNAADLLYDGRQREAAGCMPEAAAAYEAAIAAAERLGDAGTLAQALRRLAVLRYHASDPASARSLCARSFEVARGIGDDLLAAEALNTEGVVALQTGELDAAREAFVAALALGGTHRALDARCEQNLGILANIQGQHEEALTRYKRSLDAYEEVGDDRGCALAFHNLGMVSADRGLWDDADGYFRRSLEIAERAGDLHLEGLCRVNHAEVHVARQRFEDARRNAEAALAIFDQIGARAPKADAYRMIGIVYRDTGRPALAESRLRSATDLARQTDSVLGEAEASRELALLYQAMGRNQEALTLLNTAHRLFRRLEARVDLVHVGGKMAELETTFLAVVREWGQSIESSDSYTYGHCERVAEYAVSVARMLGLDAQEQTTVRLGAYLHDVGKVKVPHEVLNKPGPLTRAEFEIVQQHPVWGIELLAGVEFPWDIKPIIRWHHEKHDGSGYPDRLRGEEIPVSAQIVGIVDVYDALTTDRPYRKGLSDDEAMAEIHRCAHWWAPEVYQAFARAFGERGESAMTDAASALPDASRYRRIA